MTQRYTHGHHDSVLRSHRWRTVENSAAYLAAELRPGVSVLDVGCGPGTITVDLAQRVAPGSVVGIDASADVVAEATALAGERDVPNVEFRVADACDLPFAADSFAVVHAHQVLQHVADPVRMLRELRRVVAPGGVVAVRDVDYALTGWYPPSAELSEWLALYERVARASGGEPDAGRRLRAWAREAGFGEVVASASSWCYADDEERAWWGGSWAARVLESRFAETAIEEGLATRSDLERIRDGWLAWAADPDGWFSLTHGEVLARR